MMTTEEWNDKPCGDDTRVFAVSLADLRRAYLVAREADIDPVSAMWMNLSADCARATAPAPDAARDERRFQASLAAMQGLCANPGGPIQANDRSGWAFTNCRSDDVAMIALQLADALLAALEARQ